MPKTKKSKNSDVRPMRTPTAMSAGRDFGFGCAGPGTCTQMRRGLQRVILAPWTAIRCLKGGKDTPHLAHPCCSDYEGLLHCGKAMQRHVSRISQAYVPRVMLPFLLPSAMEISYALNARLIKAARTCQGAFALRRRSPYRNGIAASNPVRAAAFRKPNVSSRRSARGRLTAAGRMSSRSLRALAFLPLMAPSLGLQTWSSCSQRATSPRGSVTSLSPRRG